MVNTPEQFESELKLAMKADRTTLIDARVDSQVYQDSFGTNDWCSGLSRSRASINRKFC